MISSPVSYNFLVVGNPAYLRSLAEFSTGTKYFDIGGGVNDYLDCPNDDFRLRSTLFTDLESNLVCQLGYDLVSISNSLHKLFIPEYIPKSKLSDFSFQPTSENTFMAVVSGDGFEVTEPVDEGLSIKDFRRFPLMIKEFYHGYTQVELDRKNTQFSINNFCHNETELIEDIKSEILGSKKLDIFHFLLTSFIREDVYLILKLVDRIDSDSDDWSQIYKIFETIENLESITSIETQIDTTLKRKFKNSANNFSITGIDSRHGYTSNPGGNQILSYDEALAFILDISQKYLKTLLVKIKSENEVNAFRLPLGSHR